MDEVTRQLTMFIRKVVESKTWNYAPYIQGTILEGIPHYDKYGLTCNCDEKGFLYGPFVWIPMRGGYPAFYCGTLLPGRVQRPRYYDTDSSGTPYNMNFDGDTTWEEHKIEKEVLKSCTGVFFNLQNGEEISTLDGEGLKHGKQRTFPALCNLPPPSEYVVEGRRVSEKQWKDANGFLPYYYYIHGQKVSKSVWRKYMQAVDCRQYVGTDVANIIRSYCYTTTCATEPS